MAARWVLIGDWPRNDQRPHVDTDLAHVWTGVEGVACRREDYALVHPATSQPRCAVCVAWATGDPVPALERTT